MKAIEHSQMIQPTVADWARLAAFIDGEGCIYIAKRSGCTRIQGRLAGVMVTNTDPKLMQWLLDVFGGAVRPHKQGPRSHSATGKTKRQLYSWSVKPLDVAAILEGCLPYLIIKSEQAKTAIAFRKLMHHKGHCCNNPVTPEQEQQRAELHQKMSKLNDPEPQAAVIFMRKEQCA